MKFVCVLFAVFALAYAKPGHIAVAGPAVVSPYTYSAAPVVYSAPYNHVIQSNEPYVKTLVSAPLVKTVSAPIYSAPVSAPLVYSSPLVSRFFINKSSGFYSS